MIMETHGLLAAMYETRPFFHKKKKKKKKKREKNKQKMEPPPENVVDLVFDRLFVADGL